MSTKKKAKSKIEVRTEFTQIKHEFDRDETDQLVKDLTEGISNVSELEKQKKATGAEYSAKIKTQKARNQEVVNKLNAGYHMVEAQCEVEMDYSARMKRFFPIRDSGKRGAMAKQEPMSEIDLQSQLPLKDPVKKPAKPDADHAEAAPPKPAKKPRKAKVKPGQPLVSVEEAVEKASDSIGEQLITECIDVIRQEQRASVSLLQRRLKLGYTRAALIMDELENRKIVGPSKGAEPRDVLIEPDSGKGQPDSHEMTPVRGDGEWDNRVS